MGYIAPRIGCLRGSTRLTQQQAAVARTAGAERQSNCGYRLSPPESCLPVFRTTHLPNPAPLPACLTPYFVPRLVNTGGGAPTPPTQTKQSRPSRDTLITTLDWQYRPHCHIHQN